VSAEPPRRARPLGRVEAKTITLAHGGGGKAMKDLIDDVFVRAFDNPVLAPLEDQARLGILATHVVGSGGNAYLGFRGPGQTGG
jgi:hydrogenase expression/formation protein HypE